MACVLRLTRLLASAGWFTGCAKDGPAVSLRSTACCGCCLRGNATYSLGICLTGLLSTRHHITEGTTFSIESHSLHCMIFETTTHPQKQLAKPWLGAHISCYLTAPLQGHDEGRIRKVLTHLSVSLPVAATGMLLTALLSFGRWTT